MRSMRKRYDAAFKSKVAVEAIKGEFTVELPSRYRGSRDGENVIIRRPVNGSEEPRTIGY